MMQRSIGWRVLNDSYMKPYVADGTAMSLQVIDTEQEIALNRHFVFHHCVKFGGKIHWK